MDLKSIFRVNTVQVIELVLDEADGKVEVVVTKLKKESRNIKIVSSGFLHFEAITSAIDQLDKRLPSILVVSGNIVLNKVKTAESSNQIDISEVIPSDDQLFVYQAAQIKKGKAFSIIRKEEASEILKLLEDFKILDLWIGPQPLLHFQESLPRNLAILTRGYQIIFTVDASVVIEEKELGWDKGNRGDKTIQVAGQRIDPDSLPGFSAGALFFLGIHGDAKNIQKLDEIKADFKFERLSQIIGWSGALLLLVLLLVNFLVFSQMNSHNNQLRFSSSESEYSLQLIDSLETELAGKRSFFSTSGLGESSKVSFFADRIGYITPEGIAFESLVVFPEVKNDDENSYQFDRLSITIRGRSKNSSVLNLYINQLRGLDWVSDVKVLPYKENKAGIGDFELVLALR